jgi:hypothetical protein
VIPPHGKTIPKSEFVAREPFKGDYVEYFGKDMAIPQTTACDRTITQIALLLLVQVLLLLLLLPLPLFLPLILFRLLFLLLPILLRLHLILLHLLLQLPILLLLLLLFLLLLRMSAQKSLQGEYCASMCEGGRELHQRKISYGHEKLK